MKSHIFFACSEVYDKGSWDVVEGVEFVGFAKVEHVPDQSLFVRYLSMKFEMIEAVTILTQPVELETERVLSPLKQQKGIWVVGLY